MCASMFLPFLPFSVFFVPKNVEKTDFGKHLECAEPKCWSKYFKTQFWICFPTGKLKGVVLDIYPHRIVDLTK